VGELFSSWGGIYNVVNSYAICTALKEIGKRFGNDRGLIEQNPRHLSGGNGKNHEKPQPR
jgi:hypothetical protein